MITLTVATGIAVYFGGQKEDGRKASSSDLPLDILIENKREINDESLLNTEKYFEIKDDIEKVSREKSHMKIIAKAEKRGKEKKEKERERLEEEKRKAEDAKLVQLKKEEESKWTDVIASFYTSECAGCIGITYNGTDVTDTIRTPKGRRVIAVDPKLIPIDSLVTVRYDNTEFTARAADIGSAIKGYRIDVLVETESEAFSLGMKKAKIRIIE